MPEYNEALAHDVGQGRYHTFPCTRAWNPGR
jgi:hypothetical protein